MQIKRFVLIVVLVVPLLQACGGGAKASNGEAVLVPVDCQDSAVAVGDEILLYYEWQTMTRDQNKEFFDVTDHHAIVNGIPYEIMEEGDGDMMELSDGTFKQMHWMSIGVLEPGSYEIESIAEITEPVTDGWYWYGPDSEYPTMNFYCSLTVGDVQAGSGGDFKPQQPAPAVEEPIQESEPAEPLPAASTCALSTSIRPDWSTYLCETFEGSTLLWTGLDGETEIRLEEGEYIIDNSIQVASGYTTGFTLPVPLGQSANHLISVDGYIESKYKDNTWGVYVRSTEKEIVYFFMINKSGVYSLTGSTENEANRFLGNIDSGTHSAINWDATNNITAVADGKNLEFYVNDELIIRHEAINSSNPMFGLIVWGGEGVSAVTHIDNLLVKVN